MLCLFQVFYMLLLIRCFGRDSLVSFRTFRFSAVGDALLTSVCVENTLHNWKCLPPLPPCSPAMKGWGPSLAPCLAQVVVCMIYQQQFLWEYVHVQTQWEWEYVQEQTQLWMVMACWLVAGLYPLRLATGCFPGPVVTFSHRLQIGGSPFRCGHACISSISLLNSSSGMTACSHQ